MSRVDWKLSIAGLFIGVLVGMTGMGGGSLMTPMLVFLFGFKPTVAIGTDILHGAIFKSFGAVRHRQLGTVHAQADALDAARVGAVLARRRRRSRPGSSTATATASRTTAAIILGIALIAGGLGFAVKTFLTGREKSDAPFVLDERPTGGSPSSWASAGGFVVGLTSVGSGTFFGLVMLLVFPLTASKVVGTDIFHAAALLWVAGAGHLVAGNVDLHATGWLLVGSIPGVLLGSQVSINLPERALAPRARDDADARRAQARGGAGRGDRDPGRPVGRRSRARRRRRPEGCSEAPRSRCRLRRKRARHEPPAGEPVAELVRLAAGAEAGAAREQRKCGDDGAERGAALVPAGEEGEARRAQEDAPTRFANRGGRASSSGPSPKRGWTSSK